MIKEKYKKIRMPALMAVDFIAFMLVSLALYRLFRIEAQIKFNQLMIQLAILFVCMFFYKILFHTYESLWRYAEAQEYIFLFLASFCAFGTYMLISSLFDLHILVLFFMMTVTIFSFSVHFLMRFIYRILHKQGLRLFVDK